MPSRVTVVFGIGLWMTAAGCATSTEWQEWRDHTTHFGSNPRVSRADIGAARTESRWGAVITVSPEQIFEPR